MSNKKIFKDISKALRGVNVADAIVCLGVAMEDAIEQLPKDGKLAFYGDLINHFTEKKDAAIKEDE